MKTLFILLTSLLSFITIQAQTIGHDLTIWSEDGYKFTLYLNGQKMNEEPAASVQCTNLTYDYAHSRIVFEDAAHPEIERKVTQIRTNPNFTVASTVYKIVTTKKGELDLRFGSSNQKVVAPAQTVIINNGTPAPQGGTTIQVTVPNR
jgi:hypothetical protein